MSDLRKVSGPPSRIDHHIGPVLVLVVVAVLVAIVKPWGAGPSDVGSVAVAPTPLPSPSPSPRPRPTPRPVPQQYDLQAFGVREPPPMWEIWSAGSLASFSYAMRIDLHGPTSSGDTPGRPASPPLSPPAIPSDALEAVPADWPTVLVPRGDRLELIAINRPLGFTVEVVGLVKIEDDGTQTTLQPITGVSPWPDHFTVVGLGSDADPRTMGPWPTGEYRLALRIGPVKTTRTIEVAIDPGPADPSAPRPSSSPSAPTP